MIAHRFWRWWLMSGPLSSPCQVGLLPEVVADLDDHGDAFGIAGLGPGLVVGFGAELPGVAAAQREDLDAVRTAAWTLGSAVAMATSSASVLVGLLMMAA